ncbi:MAG: glutamine synthetase family protein [Kiloniellaceae bacterium]
MARADSDLVMICTSDVAGQLRGKAMPRKYLDSRSETGVGWTPTNVFITSFGPIAPSPWGALGDLFIRPDLSTLVDLELPDCGIDESFALGDVMQLDGAPWDCCLRGQLRAAVDRLEQRHGLSLRVSFEHEFHYAGAEAQPGLGYALRAFRRIGSFANRLMTVLEAAGLELDTFMPEYGPGQAEVTIGPKPALRAADEAAILRELVRATARGLGTRASFAPILDPAGVGNGVHVHFSLWDRDGKPVSHDPAAPHGVSQQAAAFIGGVLKHLPDFVAMTAPTVSSYLRLVPHRWSAAFNNLGKQDREAAVRICPVFGGADKTAERFHFEFRAADAAATPHLVLAALINAGLDGLETGLALPPVTERDLADLSKDDLADLGCEVLPNSLEAALTRMTGSAWAKAAFGETLIDVIDRHKRAEMEVMAGLSPEDVCARYAKAY